MEATGAASALPRTAHSAGASAAPATGPLAGEVAADIAVVGGGFTGLSAALHAAEAGARVVVLEANAIGWGASGRNFGQVVPYLKHEPAHALNRLGAEHGERLIQAAAGGPDLVFGLIERHDITCHAARNGLLFAAHKPAAARGLEARAAYWRQRQVDVRMLDRAETAAMIGGGSYPAALLEPRGGTINSLGYARGLARAALASGAPIHTGSRARAPERIGSRWRVATDAGAVSADRVLLCTNAYTDAVWPALARTIIPLRGHQFATRPLSEAMRRTILPGGQALTDTRHLFSGVRLHPDGRLHVSGDGPAFSAEGAPDHAKTLRRLRALFPQLGAIEFEFDWSGWIALTLDQYPRLFEPVPGILAGLGYSGRGIALATVMGRALAERALGAAPRDLAVPISPLRSIPLRPLARVAVRAMLALYRVQDALDAARFGA